MSQWQAEFDSPFLDKYQRNNKHTGRKNLRCFPACHAGGHKATGFCGQPVKLRLRGLGMPPQRLRVWAQYELAACEPEVAPGQVMSETEATRQERCRQQPTLPWLRGHIYAGRVELDCNGFEVTPTAAGAASASASSLSSSSSASEAGEATVVINAERMGWHYSWVSNKHSCNDFHVLRVYLFSVQADGRTIACVGSVASPSFQIFCRRRTRKPTSRPNTQPSSLARCAGTLSGTLAGTLAGAAACISAGGGAGGGAGGDTDGGIGGGGGSSSSSSAAAANVVASFEPRPGLARKRRLSSRRGSSALQGKVLRSSCSSLGLGAFGAVEPMEPVEPVEPVGPAHPQAPQNSQNSQNAQDPQNSQNSQNAQNAHVLTGPRCSQLGGSGQAANLPQRHLLRLVEFICCQRAATADLSGGGGGGGGGGRGAGGSGVGGVQDALEDFSSGLFGGIVCGLDMGEVMASGQEQRGPGAEQRTVAQDLATYLLQEQSFTDDICAFFQSNALEAENANDGANDGASAGAGGGEGGLSRLFATYMGLVRSHVAGFLAARGISPQQLELELQRESGKISRFGAGAGAGAGAAATSAARGDSQRLHAFKAAFLQRLRSETRPKEFCGTVEPVPAAFDVNGVWLNTGKKEQEYAEALARLETKGFPVLVYGVVRVMLWRFKATINRMFVLLEGEKKLMHNAEFLFRLDGLDHPFNLPVPLGAPPTPCMYRAGLVSGGGRNLLTMTIHGFLPRLHGVRFEIVREVHIKADRVHCDVKTWFDLIRVDGVREHVASFSQVFFRPLGDQEVNELFDFAEDILAL